MRYKGLTKEHVPNKSLNSREIVEKLSVGNWQGYVRCECKVAYVTKKCKFCGHMDTNYTKPSRKKENT